MLPVRCSCQRSLSVHNWIILCAQAREQMRAGGALSSASDGVFDGLRMLSRNRLFVKLTVCVMLSGIVMEGMYELLGQYFQLKLQFTAADQVTLSLPLSDLQVQISLKTASVGVCINCRSSPQS